MVSRRQGMVLCERMDLLTDTKIRASKPLEKSYKLGGVHQLYGIMRSMTATKLVQNQLLITQRYIAVFIIAAA